MAILSISEDEAMVDAGINPAGGFYGGGQAVVSCGCLLLPGAPAGMATTQRRRGGDAREGDPTRPRSTPRSRPWARRHQVDMDGRKPYIVAIIIRVIVAGMWVINKAAMDHGLNSFVFMFYRQTAASLVLLPVAVLLERRNARSMSSALLFKIFVCALIGITVSGNMYNFSLKLTSATVVAASSNSLPVITFCLALILRMEEVKLRSPSGVAKLTGVALCLAGVLVIALYAGKLLSPVNHHRAFAAAPTHADSATAAKTLMGAAWIKGTFVAVLAVLSWSLMLVLQAAVLKEFPSTMLATAIQSLFSVMQSFLVAVVAERDFSMWKLRLDIGLLAIIYSGFVVSGLNYYFQAWCMKMKDPVFLTAWNPLTFVLTMFCSFFFLGEMVHLGSVIGGILLCGGLYSVLWGKSRETKVVQCNIEPTMNDGGAQDEVHRELEGENQNKGMEEQEKTEIGTCIQHAVKSTDPVSNTASAREHEEQGDQAGHDAGPESPGPRTSERARRPNTLLRGPEWV